MNNTKKILALVLALMLVLGMMSALAASINVNTTGTNIKSNHVYKAYALFTGEVSQDGNKLSNIQWGSGINHAGLFTSIEANTTSNELKAKFSGLSATDKADATKVAAAIGTITEAALVKELSILMAANLGTAANSTASNPINNLNPGYYLITDETEITGNEENDAKSAYLLQILGDEDITIKTDAPSISKKVLENGANPVDANTATIGDDVSYEIETEIPNYANYDYYYFVINDDLSTGLTFNGDIVVYAATPKEGGGYNAETVVNSSSYHIYTKEANTSTHTFQVAFEDVKTDFPVGTKIFVRYSAKLNESAVVGGVGNPNETDLIYSNNPNDSGRGDTDEKPGIPDETEGPSTGTTPKDIVKTFTAEIDILKTQNDTTTPLKGAEFTLTGTSTKTVLKGKKVYTPAADGTFYRMTDGTWSTTAPTQPYMELAAAGATKGYVEDSTYTGADKVVINGTTYRPYKASTDSGKTVYVLNKGNASSYASTTQKYKESDATEITTQTYPVKMVVTSGDDGKVVFSKLGEGIYTITETVVPDGFNRADDIKIEIKATFPETIDENAKATWSVGDASSPKEKITVRTTGDPAVATVGIYDTTIVNKSGSTLPTTGGIGTTIFYVGGGLLVLLAIVLLVTKRRMSSEE